MIFKSAMKSQQESVDMNKNKLDFSLICQKLDQFIYVIGGFIEHSKFAIERLDIQSQTWEEISILESNRAKF